jgi:hypothetical protein
LGWKNQTGGGKFMTEIGSSDTFDRAVADFAVAYADQNETDHVAFLKGIREGRIEVYQEQ